MTPQEMAAVVKTIELLRNEHWDGERRLADQLQAWLKGKL